MTIFATSAQELKPVIINYENVEYTSYSDASGCIDFYFKDGNPEISFACTPECYSEFADNLSMVLTSGNGTLKFKFQ